MSQTPGRSALEKRRPGGWPAGSPFLVVLLFLLGSCAPQTQRQGPVPDLLLRLDSSEKMGGDPHCHSRRISTTEVVGAVEQSSQGVSSRWMERWTVDRCGTLVPYLVKFARSADGDLDVTMQLEKPPGEPANVPGATLADPVLQRDALGFLAQRDFTAAGAEGTCHARKVVDTEILKPLEGAAVEGERPIDGQWVERWTLDRCGMRVRYIVRFSTTQKGTRFTVEPEP